MAVETDHLQSLKTILKDLEFSEKQADIYIASLLLGPQGVSLVAKKAGLNRATGYLIVDELVKLGFMSRFEKTGIWHVSAVPLDAILATVSEKRDHFDHQHRALKEILPQMNSSTHLMLSQPKVSYFEGREGVKTVMEDTLTCQETMYCYSSLHRWFLGPLKEYIKSYGQRRVENHKIPLKTIVSNHPLARAYYAKEHPKDKKLTEIRWLKSSIPIFSNEINIYHDKVAIVSINPEQMFGVIIENSEISNTQKSIFQLAWRSVQ